LRIKSLALFCMH